MALKIFALLFIGSLFAFAFFLPKPTDPVAKPDLSVPAVKEPVANVQNPTELGAVHWSRDLDASKAEAQKSGKALLILFQEVPGCSNCTRYGSVTLRHPLIVEAIETYFVPVCIYNNKGGKDGEALRQFGEPAWNNPVVRIVHAADYQDVVPRMDNFGSSWQLVDGMQRALKTAGQPLPQYLDVLAQELRAREAGTETTTFTMSCFWSGEGTFGALRGVVATEAGYQDGHEVVRVTYDPAVTNRAALEKATQPKGITTCAANSGFRADREPKYYLAQTPYRFVPMTSLQAARANSLIGQSQSPDPVLSPRQMALAQKAKAEPKGKWKNWIGTEDLASAWEQAADAKE